MAEKMKITEDGEMLYFVDSYKLIVKTETSLLKAFDISNLNMQFETPSLEYFYDTKWEPGFICFNKEESLLFIADN